MNNYSIWKEYIKKNNENELNANLDVDVLVIGGGMTGLSTAYNLINSNLKTVLVEKNKISSGVTSKSTAKINYLQEDLYEKISKYHNKEDAKKYLESQKDAIKIITNTININKIDCDLEKVNAYLFANNETEMHNVKKQVNLLKKFGVNLKEDISLPDMKCMYSAYVDDTYVFNPVKYLNSLKDICKDNNINIYENTKIEKIEKKDNYYLCKTKSHEIKAKYVVLALHYPYFIFPFLMPLKVTLEKSYIKAYKTDFNYLYSAINIGKKTKSLRFYDNKNDIYKIELINSHNIAVKNNEEKNFENLKENYDYLWSNIDIITSDSLPLIGQIDKKLLLATGYNTWGMTNSTIAGKILSDIILKKDNQYIELFNPKRGFNKGKLLNYPISITSSIYAFIKNKISINKSWYNNIKFETRDNKKVAIYIDNLNKEHVVTTLCPHLKCSLIFNETEKTWDCPCHGSRFDIDGNCIEGPSNYNISVK